MAHCPFTELTDLKAEFDEIRTWPNINEPSPGVFYIKRVAFLHFHINRDRRRWADVRDGRDWGSELDLPFDCSRAARQAFLREVRRRYRAITGGPRA